MGLSYALANLPTQPTIAIGYNYSLDFFGEDGDGHYVNGTLDLALPWRFGLGFEIGYQDVEGDKTTGNNMGEGGGNGFDRVNFSVHGVRNSKVLFNIFCRVTAVIDRVDTDEDIGDLQDFHLTIVPLKARPRNPLIHS